MISRRRLLACLGLMAGSVALPAGALTASALTPAPHILLEPEQSDRFRAWMTLIVAEQIRNGPTPRWYHRDCAGLARFAVGEALRAHDQRWLKANGMLGRRLPPEVELRPEQAAVREGWADLEGRRQAFVTAQVLIQNNTRLLGREFSMARPGDLMFFDQGDDQHLMIWMGGWITYHTGQAPAPIPRGQSGRDSNRFPKDNGLRAVTPAELLQWKDTRWRPRDDNPNFAGFFRLAFLSR